MLRSLGAALGGGFADNFDADFDDSFDDFFWGSRCDAVTGSGFQSHYGSRYFPRHYQAGDGRRVQPYD
jgi:hypothetical protein